MEDRTGVITADDRQNAENLNIPQEILDKIIAYKQAKKRFWTDEEKAILLKCKEEGLTSSDIYKMRIIKRSFCAIDDKFRPAKMEGF